MRVRLLAFATAAEALAGRELEIELPDGARLSDLKTKLITEHPSLGEIWPRLALAVDGELATNDKALSDGSEVALLPPVSGGSGRRCDSLTDGPIDLVQLLQEVSDPACGAVLLFLGTARDHHRGRAVVSLAYHAYRPMAEKLLDRLAHELEASEPPARVGIVHRLGEVPIGEATVAIAVASPHREAAYALSRKALERLKREVPIWKREGYSNGELVWREEEALG